MGETRPTYSTSKRAMWICGGLAWVAIFSVIWGALRGSSESVAISGTVIPAMIMLIVSLLGIHRAFGSLDMHTSTRFGRNPRPRRQEANAEQAAQ